MQLQQFLHQRAPLRLFHQFLPVLDHTGALALLELPEARQQPCVVLLGIGVVAQQEVDAGVHAGTHVQTGTCAHGFDHGLGHVQVADLAAFSLDEHRTGRVQLRQAFPHPGFEAFLAGLGFIRQIAQHRTLVACQRFQVQDLAALCLDLLQDARLGAAGGAADDEHAKALCQLSGVVHHVVAEGLVAAFDAVGIPADLAKNDLHGAAALASAPAVDQRAPVLRLVEQVFLQMARDVLRDQRCADLLGLEGGDLLVDGTDAHPFLVA